MKHRLEVWIRLLLAAALLAVSLPVRAASAPCAGPVGRAVHSCCASQAAVCPCCRNKVSAHADSHRIVRCDCFVRNDSGRDGSAHRAVLSESRGLAGTAMFVTATPAWRADYVATFVETGIVGTDSGPPPRVLRSPHTGRAPPSA